MLVLSRKKGEGIQIGDAVVTVVDIRGKIVRLGIEAKKEIPIMRLELVEGDKLSKNPPPDRY